MRFLTIAAAFAAGVSAQAATTACAAQNILSACLATEQALLQQCAPNDWICMCNAQKLIVRCYANCPNDPDESTANNVEIQYCNAASQEELTMTSTSSVVVISSTPVAATTTAEIAATTVTTSSSHTAKATNGAPMFGSGSGILAAAIGIAAMI